MTASTMAKLQATLDDLEYLSSELRKPEREHARVFIRNLRIVVERCKHPSPDRRRRARADRS